MKNKAEWWRGAAFYQIYPRSFLDTDQDGIGDLKGITRKLDYIAGLGVEGVWISPFFKSPMKDFGYDVSDYRDVDPMFGTLDDFKALLDKAHTLKLKIIVDLVLSHTSDQHPWFQDLDKKDWYVWADAEPDGSPPNNWVSIFGGSAWEWSEEHGQYYLHNFLKEQPDLNFHNPAVQDEVLDIARFWLEMGVDGFRLDVVNFYFHDQRLRDNPPRLSGVEFATQFEGDDPYSAQQHLYDKSQPENLEFIRRFRKLVDEYSTRFTIGEIGDDHPYERVFEYTRGSNYLNTCYNTHLMSGIHKALTAATLRNPFESYAREPGESWPSWAFSNHDVVRAASRWCTDGEGFGHNPRLSKMLIALLGCLRGSIFFYQGEELGLPESRLAFEDLQDPWGKHLWPKWQGRDGCRTPMPWSAKAPHAGFSSVKPWLPVAQTHMDLSVDIQENDPHSTLNFTRHFLNWRKDQHTLHVGDIGFRDTQNPDMLIFERRTNEETLLCVFNLGKTGADISEFECDWMQDYGRDHHHLSAYGFAIGKLN